MKYLEVERVPSALAVYAIFGLLGAGVPLVARRRALEPAEGWPPLAYFALSGHLFLLFFVAPKAALSVPPWPFLGIVALLDATLLAAARYLKRVESFLAATVLSGFLVLIWEVAAESSPWPTVALVSAAAWSALAILGIFSFRRAGMAADSLQGHLATSSAVAALFLAQFTAIVGVFRQGPPAAWFLMAAQLLFLGTLLALAWYRNWQVLAVVALGPASLAVILWGGWPLQSAPWKEWLLFALLMHLVFLAYPLLLGPRAAKVQEPYWAAVFSSVPFFLVARHCLTVGGWGDIIGILPVFQALLLAGLLFQLLRLEPPRERMLGRQALVAGAVLAFVTVAIPLQLEKQWITLGWALEGAALAWLYARIPHRGLLHALTALLGGVFVRLALNPEVFLYWPRSSTLIWNWYLYTYAVCALAMQAAARFLEATSDELTTSLPRVSRLLPGGAAILLFLLLNIEIADFFSTGETITFNFSATLAQDLSYTLGWALFALALLAIGIWKNTRASRMASLALLVATVLKCFLHDLGRLGGLYRVVSFVGLAVCLALVAVALQRFVLAAPKEKP